MASFVARPAAPCGVDTGGVASADAGRFGRPGSLRRVTQHLMSPQEFSNMGAYISYQPIIKYGYGHMGHVYIEHRAMIEPRLPTIAHTYRQDRAQSRAPPASATVQRKLYS